MKPSQNLKFAAEIVSACSELYVNQIHTTTGYFGCEAIELAANVNYRRVKNTVEFSYFNLFNPLKEIEWNGWFAHDSNHRILALLFASYIAESEGN